MNGLAITIIIILALGLWFGLTFLFTKGVIWVALELFKTDWTSKFWAVFVMLFIVQTIVGSMRGKK